jgi:hypothetical protein
VELPEALLRQLLEDNAARKRVFVAGGLAAAFPLENPGVGLLVDEQVLDVGLVVGSFGFGAH